ncbi:MAG: MarR family winged helix-turn-helix transcriptional regulator [Caulobacteraceae bacterium]
MSAPYPPAATSALAADLRTVVGKLKRRFREQTPDGDLTETQISVLLRLERHGPTTVTALAKAEAMRPQSMGANVAALTAAGLVTGAPHPTDGRQTVLSLTDACHSWIDTSRAVRQDWLVRALQARLQPAEQDQLAAAVALLQRLADA